MPTLETLDAELLRLALWFCVMLVLALVHAVTLLVAARKVDPRPLLPLAGMLFSVQIGIRVAETWFMMHFQVFTPPYLWFREWWNEVMNPAVLRPMAWVFSALVGHQMIHWAISLRGSFKRKRGKIPTLIVSFCAVANAVIALHVAVSLFDFLFLSQKREAERAFDGKALAVWNYDEPDAEPPWFRVLWKKMIH